MIQAVVVQPHVLEDAAQLALQHAAADAMVVAMYNVKNLVLANVQMVVRMNVVEHAMANAAVIVIMIVNKIVTQHVK